MFKSVCFTLALAFSVFSVPILTGTASADFPTAEECALAGIDKPATLSAFLSRLLTAVKNDDKAAMAELVDYPIEIQSKKSLTIDNKDQFIKNYDVVMTKAVREALGSEPFVTPRGIVQMTSERAQVWLSVSDGKLLIGTIIID